MLLLYSKKPSAKPKERPITPNHAITAVSLFIRLVSDDDLSII